ncbi:hypothetical protein KKH65_01440, partial [bacterium]|nr:hypothetical protein [bacterium]
GASNSWGGELHLIFDPEVIEVDTVTSGGWITGTSGDCIAEKVLIDNESGKIDYILGGSETVSGGGVFAKVSLKVKKAGVKACLSFDSGEDENRNTQFIEEPSEDDYVLPTIEEPEPIEIFAPTIYNNLDSVICYPNPAKNQSYVTFDNLLNKPIKLKIMNIAGEVVYEKEETPISGGISGYCIKYYLKNNDNKDLSSGVYIYLLDDGSNKKHGKLGVVR